MHVAQFIILGLGLLLSIIGVKLRSDKTDTSHEARIPSIVEMLIMLSGLVAGVFIMAIMTWGFKSTINMWSMTASITVGTAVIIFLITMEWYTSIRWTKHDDVLRFWRTGSTILLGVVVLAMGLPYVADSIISTIVMVLTALSMYVMTQAEDWHMQDNDNSHWEG